MKKNVKSQEELSTATHGECRFWVWLSLKYDFLQKLKQFPFSDNINPSGFFPKTRPFVKAEAPSKLSLCENVTLC